MDHSNFFVFAFVKDYSFSVYISTRSDSSVRFTQWLYL